MNLGNKILKIRKDNKMSQEEFADKLNVTRQTISNWENAKNYPDIETIVKISDEFNISLDILLKGDKKMIQNIDKKVKTNKLLKIIIIILVIFLLGFILLTITKNYFKVEMVGSEKGLTSWCILDNKLYEIGAFVLINNEEDDIKDFREMKPTHIYVREYLTNSEAEVLKSNMNITIDDDTKIIDLHNKMKSYITSLGGQCTNYLQTE